VLYDKLAADDCLHQLARIWPCLRFYQAASPPDAHSPDPPRSALLRKSYLFVGMLAMTVMRGRSSPEVPQTGARIAQLEAGNAHCDIEAGLPLETQWLQSEGVLGTADQRIGIAAYADRGAGCNPAVAAGEIAWADPPGRREYCPHHRGSLREADIETEPAYETIVRIPRTAIRPE
jgi:hypothetical protein